MLDAKNENVDKHIKSEYVPVEPLVIFQVLGDVLSCDQGSEGNDWHEEPLLFVGYRREHYHVEDGVVAHVRDLILRPGFCDMADRVRIQHKRA